MRILLFTIIITLFFITPVLAKEKVEEMPEIPNWIINFYQETNKKLITPVKQMIDSMKQKTIEEKSQELLKETQETIKKKQEEILDKAQEKIKQEVRESTKNWIQNRIEWIETSLNPLKIRIQQGSEIIKKWVNDIKIIFK